MRAHRRLGPHPRRAELLAAYLARHVGVALVEGQAALGREPLAAKAARERPEPVQRGRRLLLDRRRRPPAAVAVEVEAAQLLAVVVVDGAQGEDAGHRRPTRLGRSHR